MTIVACLEKNDKMLPDNLKPAKLSNGQVAYEMMDTMLGDGKMTTGENDEDKTSLMAFR